MRILCMLVILGLSVNAQAKKISDEDFWQCQEAAWQARVDNDLDKFMGFFDKSFLGWTQGLADIKNLEAVRGQFAHAMSSGKMLEMNVERRGLSRSGKTAVMHFFLHWKKQGPGNQVMQGTAAQTHTVVFKSGKCSILGAMGWAHQPAPPKQ